jgi:RNA polymerase primary sigma factor
VWENSGVAETHERDRDKIAALLSEIPMRPAFIARFRQEFDQFVATARSLHDELQRAPDTKERSRRAAALREHLDGSQDTYDGLLQRNGRMAQACEGYEMAKQVMVTRNLRLAISIANGFAKGGGGDIALEDLISEGTVGLLNAVEKFDPDRGLRFSTYATAWIRQAIYRAIDTTSRSVRIPGPVLNVMRRVEDFRVEFRGRHGRNPSPEEIEQGFKGRKTPFEVTAKWVRDTQSVARPPVSLEAPDDRSGLSGRMRDTVLDKGEPPQELVERKLMSEGMREHIERILATTLKPRQLEAIRLRFGLDGGEPMTLKEVGLRLRVTREAVRQIEIRAFRALEASELAKFYGRGSRA